MRAKLASVVGGGAAIVAALSFVPASAAISTPYAAVEVAPARLELAVPDAQAIHRTFVIANPSSSAESVSIAAADFTVEHETYQFLPPGATPWSIAPGLSVSSSELLLQPKGQAKLQLTYMPLSQTSLRAGVLLFTPTLTGSAQASAGGSVGVIVKQQVAVPILAVPAGTDGKLDTRVSLRADPAGMQLPSALGWPQLSFQEAGPITAQATFRNGGNAIARFDTIFFFSNLGRDFLMDETPPGVALPGQTATASGSTKVTLPGQGRVDVAPLFCICKVRAESHLVLLDSASPQAAQERLVIVAPWRVLGAILAILVGIWWARHRFMPSAAPGARPGPR